MKREFLKGLGIEEENINYIMAENGKDIESLRAEVQKLEQDIQGKDAIIQNNSANFDNSVNQKVQEIKNSMLIENAVTQKFKDVNPALAELLKMKIDKTKISVSETGQIEGLDEQFTILNETYKDLLKPASGTQVGTQKGGIPSGGTPGNGTSLENLSYEDYVKARKKEEKGED